MLRKSKQKLSNKGALIPCQEMWKILTFFFPLYTEYIYIVTMNRNQERIKLKYSIPKLDPCIKGFS